MDWDLTALNPNRKKFLIQKAQRSTNQEIQRMNPEKRYPLPLVNDLLVGSEEIRLEDGILVVPRLQAQVLPDSEADFPKKTLTADVTVSGTVRNNNSEPIPGVTVSVEGAGIGTATDLEGKYSLLVPEEATLVFSFIGFVTQRIVVGDQQKFSSSFSPIDFFEIPDK